MNSDQAYVEKTLGTGLSPEFHSLQDMTFKPDLTPVQSTIKVGTILEGMRKLHLAPNEGTESPIHSRDHLEEPTQGQNLNENNINEYMTATKVPINIQLETAPLGVGTNSKKDFGQQMAMASDDSQLFSLQQSAMQ